MTKNDVANRITTATTAAIATFPPVISSFPIYGFLFDFFVRRNRLRHPFRYLPIHWPKNIDYDTFNVTQNVTKPILPFWIHDSKPQETVSERRLPRIRKPCLPPRPKLISVRKVFFKLRPPLCSLT